MFYISLDREEFGLLFDVLVYIIHYIVLEMSANYQNGRKSPVSIINTKSEKGLKRSIQNIGIVIRPTCYPV